MKTDPKSRMSEAACEPLGMRHPVPSNNATPGKDSSRPFPEGTFDNSAGGSKDYSKVAEK
jgi:hypothetical protein